MYCLAVICAGMFFAGATCSFSNVEAQVGTLATNTINNNGSTVTSGFVTALTALYKQNPTDAKLASTALSGAAANALAIFTKTSLPLAADAQVALNAFSGKLPASATGIVSILTGAMTLIQMPTVSTGSLSAATCTTAANLCNEIIAACNQFNASIAPPAAATAPATVGS